MMSTTRRQFGLAALALGLAASGKATAAVTRTELTSPSLTGRLHAAPGRRPSVGVLMLNGSDGGIPDAAHADDLAAAGFPTLALAYMQDGSGQPSSVPALGPFPLERVFSGIDFLRARPEVAQGVVILGLSRGAELALLTASLRPEVAGVAAFSPGSHVWGAPASARGVEFDRSMWSLAGRPVPYQRHRPDFRLGVRDWFARAPDLPEAAIPVERIRGPVLLVSSTVDGIWPAATYADEIEARLRRHRFPFPVTNLQYDDASHLLMGPGPALTELPVPGTAYVVRFGGSAEGTLAARTAAWSAAKAFLTRIATSSG